MTDTEFELLFVKEGVGGKRGGSRKGLKLSGKLPFKASNRASGLGTVLC